MKNATAGVAGSLAGACLLAFCWSEAAAQSLGPGSVWRYTLLPGSTLVDSCPICGRPDIEVPLKGSFQLRLVEANPVVSSYAIENIAFSGGTPGANYYAVGGGGKYEQRGEVALIQVLSLEVQITNSFTNTLCLFSSGASGVASLWPVIEASADQTNGTLLQQYRLTLVAAPFHEIWFSTRNSFHNGLWQSPTNLVSAGDLLATSGRIVKRNHELAARLGIMPIAPDLGLKDADVLPGGEVVFSIEEDIFSESLGPLHRGDLLSERGRIVLKNAQLVAPFVPQPPVEDTGLDALQVLDGSEVYFSVQTNFFSEALGRVIRTGDLLSNRGLIVRTQESLVGRFGPSDPKTDYGLQSVYVWPSGEVWFSTEKGFVSTNSTLYGPGDLLSDQGYVVYRNLDLLAPFSPLEDLANFGLDALFIVTDVAPSPPAPLAASISIPPGTSDVHLQFTGQGRVFQVEKALSAAGPWRPASPIWPQLEFTDFGALQQASPGFYRLRAW